MIRELAYKPAGYGASENEGHRSCDCCGDHPHDLTDLLIPTHDLVLLGNQSFSVWLPRNENGVVHLEQTFTSHAMKRGSRLLALKLIVEHQRY
jgi:hypothetical protein